MDGQLLRGLTLLSVNVFHCRLSTYGLALFEECAQARNPPGSVPAFAKEEWWLRSWGS